MKADIISTPVAVTIADRYTTAKRWETKDGFTYPEGNVAFERVHNEYALFPVVYEGDVRDAIAGIVLSDTKGFFINTRIIGKVVSGNTIFVITALNKSKDEAELAMCELVRKMGYTTVPFSIEGFITLDEDFIAEADETVYADGVAACVDEAPVEEPPVEEPAPIDPALEEAYASLEKAIAEAEADPTSRSKARKVSVWRNRIAELGGEV